MDAGLLDVLHDAGDEDVLPSHSASTSDLGRVGQVAIEQERVSCRAPVLICPSSCRWGSGPSRPTGSARGACRADSPRTASRSVDDRHGPPAEHVGRTHHEGQAEILRDQPRLLDRVGDAVLGLLQAELVEQTLEAVAGPRRGRSCRARCRGSARRRPQQRRRASLERRSGLRTVTITPVERPRLALRLDDLEHVLLGQRLEIEPVPRCRSRSRRSRDCS